MNICIAGKNSIAVDAVKYILEDKSYFIFMFNPFDEFVMKKFIENNYSNFVKNNSTDVAVLND